MESEKTPEKYAVRVRGKKREPTKCSSKGGILAGPDSRARSTGVGGRGGGHLWDGGIQ